MMGDELVAFRRLHVGDEAARAPERRLRRATPGAANQLNRLCLDNIEQIVRALDKASARTMRAAARLLCAHVDANVSFDYAALGALDRACPTDEEVSGVLISSFVLSHFHVVSLLSLLSHLRAQVMRLVEVTAEDELAYVDIALITWAQKLLPGWKLVKITSARTTSTFTSRERPSAKSASAHPQTPTHGHIPRCRHLGERTSTESTTALVLFAG
jgi:hypothetical protein